MQQGTQERGQAWLRRDQVYKAVAGFTDDPDMRARLQRAVGKLCPWDQGSNEAYRDWLRQVDVDFAAFVREMAA